MTKARSLEYALLWRLATLNALLLGLVLILCITLKCSDLAIFTILLATAASGLALSYPLYHKVTDVCDRFASQLEALGNDEFNAWYFAAYQGGRLGALKQDLQRLTAKAADKHKSYLQSESLQRELISHLDLPMLMLDSQTRLHFANAAFEGILSAPLSLPGSETDVLGLTRSEQGWQLTNPELFNGRYQISAHTLMYQGRTCTLLAFLSIEQALRDNEKSVWRQLIRVLNHEVRNSLTPISSLCQSLQTMKQQGLGNNSEKELEADMLGVIEQRARHLLEFVKNASTLSAVPPARRRYVTSEEINRRLQTLFPTLKIAKSPALDLMLDPDQLEQALINLVKNAQQASAGEPVTLQWQQQDNTVLLEIIDQGSGISNPDNLFVPFYTTKPGGSGIGLVISRELIRNQQGELTIENRENARGCRAQISLPGVTGAKTTFSQ